MGWGLTGVAFEELLDFAGCVEGFRGALVLIPITLGALCSGSSGQTRLLARPRVAGILDSDVDDFRAIWASWPLDAQHGFGDVGGLWRTKAARAGRVQAGQADGAEVRRVVQNTSLVVDELVLTPVHLQEGHGGSLAEAHGSWLVGIRSLAGAAFPSAWIVRASDRSDGGKFLWHFAREFGGEATTVGHAGGIHPVLIHAVCGGNLIEDLLGEAQVLAVVRHGIGSSLPRTAHARWVHHNGLVVAEAGVLIHVFGGLAVAVESQDQRKGLALAVQPGSFFGHVDDVLAQHAIAFDEDGLVRTWFRRLGDGTEFRHPAQLRLWFPAGFRGFLGLHRDRRSVDRFGIAGIVLGSAIFFVFERYPASFVLNDSADTRCESHQDQCDDDRGDPPATVKLGL